MTTTIKSEEQKEDENEEDDVDDDNNDDDFVVVVVAVVGRAGVTMIRQRCRSYNMYMSPDWTAGLAALSAARFPLMRKQTTLHSSDKNKYKKRVKKPHKH